MSRLEVDVTEDITTVCEFEGDLFETEDQRNWTDASFKTYCTPLVLGFPHRLGAGETRAQAVTVYTRGDAPATDGAADDRVRLELGPLTGTRVPDIGFALPAGAPAPSAAECRLLRVLSPAHVRVDLHMADADAIDTLTRAIAAAQTLGAQLELALSLRASDPLDSVRDLVAGAPVAGIIVLPEDAQTTTEEETNADPRHLLRRPRGDLRRPGPPDSPEPHGAG